MPPSAMAHYLNCLQELERIRLLVFGLTDGVILHYFYITVLSYYQ